MSTQDQPTQTTTAKAPPPPSLEQQNEELPESQLAEINAPDVAFVMHVMSMCIAQKFTDGGDTRYVAQNAFHTAREALGVLVATGVMESHTIIRIGGQNEPLYKSPAVPPMNAPPRVAPVMT